MTIRSCTIHTNCDAEQDDSALYVRCVNCGSDLTDEQGEPRNVETCPCCGRDDGLIEAEEDTPVPDETLTCPYCDSSRLVVRYLAWLEQGVTQWEHVNGPLWRAGLYDSHEMVEQQGPAEVQCLDCGRTAATESRVDPELYLRHTRAAEDLRQAQERSGLTI